MNGMEGWKRSRLASEKAHTSRCTKLNSRGERHKSEVKVLDLNQGGWREKSCLNGADKKQQALLIGGHLNGRKCYVQGEMHLQLAPT